MYQGEGVDEDGMAAVGLDQLRDAAGVGAGPHLQLLLLPGVMCRCGMLCIGELYLGGGSGRRRPGVGGGLAWWCCGGAWTSSPACERAKLRL
jgi:hypothetical protein